MTFDYHIWQWPTLLVSSSRIIQTTTSIWLDMVNINNYQMVQMNEHDLIELNWTQWIQWNIDLIDGLRDGRHRRILLGIIFIGGCNVILNSGNQISLSLLQQQRSCDGPVLAVTLFTHRPLTQQLNPPIISLISLHRSANLYIVIRYGTVIHHLTISCKSILNKLKITFTVGSSRLVMDVMCSTLKISVPLRELTGENILA